MKKKLIFLLILVLGFGIFLAIRVILFGKENDGGRLKIVASPTATVFIDNVAMGKTPYEEKLKEGEYVLKLIPEGNASNTASWQGKVRVNNNALTYVNRELGSSDITSAGEIFTVNKMEKKDVKGGYGSIAVETDPAGAIVYLDNDEKGVSPLIMNEVPKGDHEISVYMPGFFRRTHKINVDSGYQTSTTFKLALDQTQKNIEQLQKENQAKKDKEASESAKTEATPPSDAKEKVTISDTPTGWLRVRSEPSLNGEEIAKVDSKKEFSLIEETDGWYKIQVEDGKQGWISSEYAEKSDTSDEDQ